MKNKYYKHSIRKYEDFEDVYETIVSIIMTLIIFFLTTIFLVVYALNYITTFVSCWEKLIILIALAISYSAIATICYCYKRNRRFYFADLPLRTPSGLFIFISCFVSWPFFIISRIRLHKFKRRYEMSNRYRSNLEAGVPLYEMKPAFDKIGLIEYYRRKQQINDDNKSKNPVEVFDKIKSLQGVRQIFIDRRGRLVIAVWIFCKIEEKVYDIGDFRIVIDNNRLRAMCDRRGIDCLLYKDQYEKNDAFRSFGRYMGGRYYLVDKEKRVDEYMKEGNVAEAVELAIMSIEYVNKVNLKISEAFSNNESI